MAQNVSIYTYAAMWRLALPFVRARLRKRAARDAAYVAHSEERFAENLPAGPFDVWIHAVSVGETRAAQPLIARWLAERPSARILLTHMTPTGRATGVELFGERVTRCYLPYDHPRFARDFIARVQPKLGLIMETELWPNVIHAAASTGIPLWLVNARLSEKSARGYHRWPSLTRATVGALRGVLAQSEAEAARFRALGATRVEVLGNLKFDVSVPTPQIGIAAALRERLGTHTFWVAGSTREGDEAQLLTALQTHPLRHRARALIVPRHPQRFDEVFGLATRFGFRVARRSAELGHADAEIIIGDSMGEMFAYYALASVTVMGGSFAHGSQNLIEPCAVGSPVVLGPSIFNFESAAQAAIAGGAAVQVMSTGASLDAVQSLLEDGAKRTAMSAAARQFCAANQGALEKTWRIVTA